MISNESLLLAPLLGFLITLFLIPFWIRKSKQIGLMWDDLNKKGFPKVAGSGGIIVITGFSLALLSYIAYRVFLLQNKDFLVEMLALFSVILLAAGIGLVDDLLGWRRGGLSKRSRIIMLAFSAIPLMAINAGRSQILVPLVGHIDTGLLYPLIIIPIGVIGATSTYNFLAGFNGLEAGQGIILLTASALVAYFTGNSWLSIISLCMIFPLAAFLIYNVCPAKVFPGDSLTYGVGALLAAISILGNFEKIAVFFFIPYALEFILKTRGSLMKYSFGSPNSDGTLNLRYDKFYSLNHVAIYILNKFTKATERKVVLLVWLFQILIISIAFLVFRDGIFR